MYTVSDVKSMLRLEAKSPHAEYRTNIYNISAYVPSGNHICSTIFQPKLVKICQTTSLVVSTPLKHINQLGLLFPIYGEI